MGYRTRSSAIVLTMSGLLFGVLFLANEFYLNYSIWFPIIGTLLGIFFQYLISPIIIGWIYRIDWMDPNIIANQYPHFAALFEKVVREYNLKQPPRFGVIPDGNPNAFCFGWTKNSARLVITDGILELLDEKEQKAVVGHELGHIVHQDFIVMTFINAIPIMFYTIYRVLMRTRTRTRTTRSRSSGSGDRGNVEAALALGKIGLALVSYLMYVIGTFVALFLSRIREYWADQFSAEINEDSNALSTALVKIAYGILQEPDKTKKRQNKSQYVRALGIFDKKSAKELAFSSTNSNYEIDHNIFAKAAAWDLYQPWAKYFTLFSTHPLPAKRIKKLNDYGEEELGITSSIDLRPAKQEFKKQMGSTALDEFLGELTIQVLPTVIFWGWVIASLTLLLTGYDFTSIAFLPFNNFLSFMSWAFVFMGIFMLIRNAFKYKSGYKEHNILQLVGQINVSPIRPVPTRTKGKIIGRGVPGLFWSEDIVIRDANGLVYVDYDYGVGIINTLFGIFRVNKLKGKNVEVEGWYRRGPSPYIQVRKIKLLDGSGKIYNNRKKGIYMFGAILTIIIGLALWYFLNMATF